MKIVIASVLKPADDVRAFKKMAMTLVSAGHEVYLIGMPATTEKTPPGIHFMELEPFHRLDWKRLMAPLKIFKKVRKVKPEVLIVNTHELLLISFLNRILFGAKIVYDLRENYYRNIRWTESFPRWLRRPLAVWVRLKEKLLVPFFHRVIVAEKCYRNEMGFLPPDTLVLENKSELPADFERHPEPGKIVLAFTGTLDESTGVFEAIEITEKLYEKRADVELHIIGFCAKANVLADIRNRCTGRKYIRLSAGRMQVSHDSIMGVISKANFGLISYPPSPHTADRIPTKLFEYMSVRLPIIIQNNPAWTELTDPIAAAIVIDFPSPDVDHLIKEMTDRTFYTGPVDDFFWKTEKKKLVDLIETLRS